MLSRTTVMICFLCVISCFVAVLSLVKALHKQRKGYCEYCGLHKSNIILWIKDGDIHYICEECVKEGIMRDEKNE